MVIDFQANFAKTSSLTWHFENISQALDSWHDVSICSQTFDHFLQFVNFSLVGFLANIKARRTKTPSLTCVPHIFISFYKQAAICMLEFSSWRFPNVSLAVNAAFVKNISKAAFLPYLHFWWHKTSQFQASLRTSYWTLSKASPWWTDIKGNSTTS